MLRMVDSTYLSRQPEVTAHSRQSVVDTIVDLHDDQNLLPETLHLAVCQSRD